jgi:hypothetical protein
MVEDCWLFQTSILSGTNNNNNNNNNNKTDKELSWKQFLIVLVDVPVLLSAGTTRIVAGVIVNV